MLSSSSSSKRTKRQQTQWAPPQGASFPSARSVSSISSSSNVDSPSETPLTLANPSEKPVKLGTVIHKEFKSGWFYGQVASWPPEFVNCDDGTLSKEEECSILYSDGDSESLPISQIKDLMTTTQNPFHKMQNSKKINGCGPECITGTVQAGPFWKVAFETAETKEELLDKRTIQSCAINMPSEEEHDEANESSMKPSPAKRTKKDLSDLERLKKDLWYCCSFTKEEIELVLPHLKPPYCMNILFPNGGSIGFQAP
jgi:hypothetical protein